MEDWTFQEHYDMEDRHWWFRSRRRVISALADRAQTPPSPRILDAGCGTGRNLMDFRAMGPAEGVDLSPEAVKFCHRRGLLDVHEAPIEQLPFEDGRFDLIFATDVIEHLPDDGPALTELRRVAAPGCSLIVTVPAYTWLWSQHDTSWQHFRRYTRPRLHERLTAHGWQPTVSTYFYSTMLPPVAAVRTFQRFRSNGNGNGKSDLHLSPGGLDKWLELPVRAEAALIRRGASLPAGVSLGTISTVR
ncbi:MAG TPA: class I SAM-dependent methyltransferase [Thermoleophilaceae bacterium]|nr:class I SAM-dependent methyltransferase [Thermoleophilaceae bacterium]